MTLTKHATAHIIQMETREIRMDRHGRMIAYDYGIPCELADKVSHLVATLERSLRPAAIASLLCRKLGAFSGNARNSHVMRTSWRMPLGVVVVRSWNMQTKEAKFSFSVCGICY